jgi:hypothetical protein
MAKMADGKVTRGIEEALNEIVITTDKSGNMKKELKKMTYENGKYIKKIIC